MLVEKHALLQTEENLKYFNNSFQAIQLGSRERLLAFCEAVQRSSPVGSFTRPIAGTTPGYASEVWPHLVLHLSYLMF